MDLLARGDFSFTILFLKQLVQFLRLSWGCLNTPYETYRKISRYSYSHQIVFIAFMMFFYFSIATVVKQGLDEGIINILISSTKAIIVALVTFLFSASTLYIVGNLFNGKGSFTNFVTLWSFTLLPTLAWFLISATSFYILPPPRSTSIFGQTFSAVFLTFSIGCLIWKVILYYLTLRFGLKLDTFKIVAVSLISLPLMFTYAAIFYKLGIFRVPFM